MEEQVQNQQHYHHRHLHGTGYDGFKETGRHSENFMSRFFRNWWRSQKADYRHAKDQGIQEICIRIILPMAVMMLLFRFSILLTTIYSLSTGGVLAFIGNFAYMIGWLALIPFFNSYYHFDEKNKSYLIVKNMRNTSFIVALAAVFKVVATLAKLFFNTPSNTVSIVYLVGELIVWLAMAFFFFSYWNKMKKKAKKMRREYHSTKM